MKSQERETVELLRSRDQRGAEELMLHYGPLMNYILMPILPNAQDREECLSEIVLKVWEKVDTYDSARGSWTVWLTAVSRNTALNCRKRLEREQAGELSEEVPDREPTPEEALLQKENSRALAQAMETLSKKDRALLYRKYYYLQPIAQIAAETGMTQRAVEGRLYRIKGKLRKILGGEGYDGA